MVNSGSDLSDVGATLSSVPKLPDELNLKVYVFLIVVLLLMMIYIATLYGEGIKTHRVFILGPTNSGKTCLFYKIINNRFPQTVTSQITNFHVFYKNMDKLVDVSNKTNGTGNTNTSSNTDSNSSSTNKTSTTTSRGYKNKQGYLKHEVQLYDVNSLSYFFGVELPGSHDVKRQFLDENNKFVFVFDSSSKKSYKMLANMLVQFFVLDLLRKLNSRKYGFMKGMASVNRNMNNGVKTGNNTNNNNSTSNTKGSVNRDSNSSSTDKTSTTTQNSSSNTKPNVNKKMVLLVGNKNDLFNSKNLDEMNKLILVELELLLESFINVNYGDNLLIDLLSNARGSHISEENKSLINNLVTKLLLDLKDEVSVAKTVNGLGGYDLKLISCSVKNDDLKCIKDFILK